MNTREKKEIFMLTWGRYDVDERNAREEQGIYKA